MNLVTAADDKCQNGRKFTCGWSTSAKLYLYRTGKNTQTGKIITEPVECKWCVEAAHLVLVLHDTWSNIQHATRRGGWNPTRKTHIPTLQLHSAHQLIQHDGDGRTRPIFFWLVLLTHKISSTGPTQIQDNHKNDHSTVRESCLQTWCWANCRQWTLLLSRHIQLCINSKRRASNRVAFYFFFFYILLTMHLCIIF